MKPKTGLKQMLDAGHMVMGSSIEKKLKPLSGMSAATQRRLGYADGNGYWTDRGYDRATTQDYAALERSRRTRLKPSK